MAESIIPTLKALSDSPDQGDPVLDEALARAKLSAYAQQNRRDQTVQILTAFIDNLPSGGKRVIVRFIATCDRLYELAEHLRMAVLIPSMCLCSILYIVANISFYRSESTRWEDAAGDSVTIRDLRKR
jgi:hypothetical protein